MRPGLFSRDDFGTWCGIHGFAPARGPQGVYQRVQALTELLLRQLPGPRLSGELYGKLSCLWAAQLNRAATV
jgi:hypothetical protein